MEMKSFRQCNPIKEAFTEGKIAVALEPNKNNQYRLTRFRKSHDTRATGKEIDGKYVVVFWDNLIKGEG